MVAWVRGEGCRDGMRGSQIVQVVAWVKGEGCRDEMRGSQIVQVVAWVRGEGCRWLRAWEGGQAVAARVTHCCCLGPRHCHHCHTAEELRSTVTRYHVLPI